MGPAFMYSTFLIRKSDNFDDKGWNALECIRRITLLIKFVT